MNLQLGLLGLLPFDVIRLILLRLKADKTALLNFELTNKLIRQRCYLGSNNIFLVILQSINVMVDAIEARGIYIKYQLGVDLQLSNSEVPKQLFQDLRIMKVITTKDEGYDVENAAPIEITRIYVLASDWRIYMIDGNDFVRRGPANLIHVPELGENIKQFHATSAVFDDSDRPEDSSVKHIYTVGFDNNHKVFRQRFYTNKTTIYTIAAGGDHGNCRTLFDTYHETILRSVILTPDNQLLKFDDKSDHFSFGKACVKGEVRGDIVKLISWVQNGFFYLNSKGLLCFAEHDGPTYVKMFEMKLKDRIVDPKLITFRKSYDDANSLFIAAVGSMILIYKRKGYGIRSFVLIKSHGFEAIVDRIYCDYGDNLKYMLKDDNRIYEYDLKQFKERKPGRNVKLYYRNYNKYDKCDVGLGIVIVLAGGEIEGIVIKSHKELFADIIPRSS